MTGTSEHGGKAGRLLRRSGWGALVIPLVITSVDMSFFLGLIVERRRCATDCFAGISFLVFAPTVRFLDAAAGDAGYPVEGPAVAGLVVALLLTYVSTLIFWWFAGRLLARIVVARRPSYALWWTLYLGTLLVVFLTRYPVAAADTFGWWIGSAVEILTLCVLAALLVRLHRRFPDPRD